MYQKEKVIALVDIAKIVLEKVPKINMEIDMLIRCAMNDLETATLAVKSAIEDEKVYEIMKNNHGN